MKFFRVFGFVATLLLAAQVVSAADVVSSSDESVEQEGQSPGGGGH